MTDNLLVIGASMIANEAHLNTTDSLEERLKAAMKVGKDHWMILGEDERFRASVGAVLLSASEEEQERLKAELQTLKAFSAMCSGVPVDMEAFGRNLPENPVGLLKLWQEAKAA